MPPRLAGRRHHREEHRRRQRHLGPHEGPEAGDERDRRRPRRGQAEAALAMRGPGPELQAQPHDADPADHQPGLESGTGEVAGRRQHDIDEDAERQEQHRPARRGASGPAVHDAGAQHRARHRQHAQRERQAQRDQLEAVADDLMGAVDEIGPQRGGVGLDPLPRVEHRAVAGHEVADRPQHDETVVGDPPPLPCAGEEDRHHHGEPGPENRVAPTASDHVARRDSATATALRRHLRHRASAGITPATGRCRPRSPRSGPTARRGPAGPGRPARCPRARPPARRRRRPRSAGPRW